MSVVRILQVACFVGCLCFILLMLFHQRHAATIVFTLTMVVLLSMFALRALIEQSKQKRP